MTLVRLICCGLFIAVALEATAADSPPPIDITTVRRLTKPAPTRAEFPKASIRIPEGLRYVTPDNLAEFAERMKLALAGDELGAVIPEDVAWHTMIFTIKDDPLAKQTDTANLDKDSLMAWLDKFTGDHAPRKAGVGRTLKLGSWTHTPNYNAEKKILILGNRISVDGADTDVVNYKVFLYGPENQIICLQTVAPITGWEKPIAKAQKLNEEVMFPPVAGDGAEDDTLMYYAKLAGGGLVGAMLVVLVARMMNGRRRAPAASPLRRPGLPR